MLKEQRLSNFDLLKIISMLFIVLGHVILHSGILNNTSGMIHNILEIIFFTLCVHVNIFILITGYFQIDREFKWKKLATLISKVVFYKISVSLILYFFFPFDVSLKDLLIELIPFNLESYWFIANYILLYLLSPYINMIINKLAGKELKKYILILILCFSLLPFLSLNLFTNNNGYTLYQFILMYSIGAFIKKENIVEKIKNIKLKKLKLFFAFILCIIINYGIFKFAQYLSVKNNTFFFNTISAMIYNHKLDYNNIFLIIQSISLFLLFSTFNIKNKLISYISSSTLAVYIIHENPFMRQNLYRFFGFNNTYNYASSKIFLDIIILVALIFVMSVVIDKILDYIIMLFKRKGDIMKFKKIDKKDIIIFLIPFCLFMFLLLVFYPGIITYDGHNQWSQIVSNNISNAHPFFSTYFMLLLSKIWNSPTIVLMFQVFIFSYFWMLICKNIRKNNQNSFKKELIYTIIISFIPIISLYSITLWKDILYSYYLMAIAYYIYKGIKDNFKYTSFEIFNIGLLITLVFNYRHNGMITAILLLVMFIIIFVKEKMGFKKLLIVILTFLSLNVLISIPKKIYLEKNNESNTETKEGVSTIDSYIIWMYGAHVVDDNIKGEDLEQLNKIIPIDDWKNVYDPFLINSTGFYDRDNHYYNENKEYFRKTFMNYTLKNPFTIIKHYLKADALLWSPIPVGYVYSFDYTEWWPKYEFNNGEVYGYDGINIKFPIVKKIVEKLTSFTLYFPFKLFYQPANALYVSIIAIFLLIKQNKNKKYWLLLAPCILNILPLIPTNLAQDLRYVYINYLTLLVIALIFICEYDFTKIREFVKRKKNKQNA